MKDRSSEGSNLPASKISATKELEYSRNFNYLGKPTSECNDQASWSNSEVSKYKKQDSNVHLQGDQANLVKDSGKSYTPEVHNMSPTLNKGKEDTQSSLYDKFIKIKIKGV